MVVRALRSNKGKPELRYLLTFPHAAEGIARVSMYGASKYALYNYMMGAPASQQVDCLMRHLNDWWGKGKNQDEDAAKHGFDIHPLYSLAWNAMRLAEELTTRPELDDRPCKLVPLLEKAARKKARKSKRGKR